VIEAVVGDLVPLLHETTQHAPALRPAQITADGEQRQWDALGPSQVAIAAERAVIHLVPSSGGWGAEPVDGVVVMDLVQIDRDRTHPPRGHAHHPPLLASALSSDPPCAEPPRRSPDPAERRCLRR